MELCPREDLVHVCLLVGWISGHPVRKNRASRLHEIHDQPYMDRSLSRSLSLYMHATVWIQAACFIHV